MLSSLQQENLGHSSPFGAFAPCGLLAKMISMTRQANLTWSSKRYALLLRHFALRWVAHHPIDVQALGAKMRLLPREDICEKHLLFTPQYFDPLERSILASHLTPRFVFLDVGAHVGAYALFVAAQAPQTARILAIEPQPDIFERLVFNIQQNAFANIKALECALADVDGDAILFLPMDRKSQASLRFVQRGSSTGRLKVQTKSLLTLIMEEGLDHVDAIKLDTEGGTDLILEPFLQQAPRILWPHLLMIEQTSLKHSPHLREMLLHNGYQSILHTRSNEIFTLGEAQKDGS